VIPHCRSSATSAQPSRLTSECGGSSSAICRRRSPARSAGRLVDLTKPEKPQAARHRTTRRGKAGADQQGQGGAAADATQAGTRQGKDQTDQRRPQGSGRRAARWRGCHWRCRRVRAARSREWSGCSGIGRSRTRRRRLPCTRRCATPPHALPERPPAPVPGSMRPSRSRRECRPDNAGRRAIPRSARQNRPPPARGSLRGRSRPPIGRAPPRGRTAARRTSNSAR